MAARKKTSTKKKAKTRAVDADAVTTATTPPPAPDFDIADLVTDLAKIGRAEVLGDSHAVRLPGVIPTGVWAVDETVIGRGGLPMGRLTTLCGSEGGGKTTLLLHALANVQRMGGFGVLIEKENKLDDTLVHAVGKAIGVDWDRVILSRPPYLEKAMEVIEKTCAKVKALEEKTGRRVPCLVVLDSVDGIDPKAVATSGHEDQHYGPTAKVLSQSLPRVLAAIEEEAVALLFVTQLRMKIGVVFGKKDKMTGGKALAFYSCLILETKHVQRLKRGDEPIGSRVKVESIKNQVAAPFRTGEYDLYYGKGADTRGSLVEFAYELGVVENVGKKKAKRYTFGDTVLGSSFRMASKKLRADPDLEAAIVAEVRREQQTIRAEEEAEDDEALIRRRKAAAAKREPKKWEKGAKGAKGDDAPDADATADEDEG